jgi:hypothetical protein
MCADGMLVSFNISRTFTANKEDLSLVKNADLANDYWKNITAGRNNGLVSISITWAKAHGLNSSGQKTGPERVPFKSTCFINCTVWVHLLLFLAAEQAEQIRTVSGKT